VEQYAEHLEFVDELESRGCTLTTEVEDWRQRSWGDFSQITESILAIRACEPSCDDTLAEFVCNSSELLESLRLVEFSNSRLTDTGLCRLASLSALLHVDVRNTAVSAQGIRQLSSQLRHLEAIHIGGTAINWLCRLKLRRRFRDVEIITDMNESLDCSPRTRYSHLAELALG